jgi:hypothetical protein
MRRPPCNGNQPHACPVRTLAFVGSGSFGKAPTPRDLGLPGNFIGVPACLFDVAVNSVSSLTGVMLSAVSFEKLSGLFAQFPRLGAALFWSTTCDAAMYGEHLVDLGRRSAFERLAHLILELLAQLREAGLAGELSYTLPLTQELMADVLGLS